MTPKTKLSMQIHNVVFHTSPIFYKKLKKLYINSLLFTINIINKLLMTITKSTEIKFINCETSKINNTIKYNNSDNYNTINILPKMKTLNFSFMLIFVSVKMISCLMPSMSSRQWIIIKREYMKSSHTQLDWKKCHIVWITFMLQAIV